MKIIYVLMSDRNSLILKYELRSDMDLKFELLCS